MLLCLQPQSIVFGVCDVTAEHVWKSARTAVIEMENEMERGVFAKKA